MKKILTLGTVLAIVAAINACGDSETAKAPEPEMAKTSELAQMMRDMHEYAAQLRASILEDSLAPMPNFAKDIYLMKTAVATDPSVKTPVFEGLSDVFIESLQKVSNPSEGKIFSYNNMLDACVNCHKAYCPGPIKKINKLRI
jgi:cytochrome c556